MIDIHSHVLPGIDDGAGTFDDSIEILSDLSSNGVTDVIATPHYVKESQYTSPVESNMALLDELVERLKEEDISINVYLGNEIYIDEDIKGLIDTGQVFPLNGGEYLLVEFPLNDEFPNYEDYLSSLLMDGYKVVLAHPERYLIAQEDYSVLEDLYELGVLFQCNIGSIYGKYGKSAQKLLKKLAKDKKIFTFGTDTHHAGGGRNIGVAYRKLLKYYSKDELEKLMIKNPQKIIS